MYEIECDGECVLASMNPDNCGGCGVTCGEGEACSGGYCIAQQNCPEGEDYELEARDQSCVDTRWDEQHCGTCGNSCGEGEGCNFGTCESTDECCTPLECVEGICQIAGQCGEIGEECGDIDDCCAGLLCEEGACMVIP